MDEPVTGIHNGADEALLRSARALTAGVTVSLGDLSIRVTAADESKATAIASMLGALEDVREPPDLSIDVVADPHPLPERAPDETYRDLVLWREEDALVLRHRTGATGLATPAGFALATSGEGERVAVRRMFQPAVTHTFAHHDRFVLHAGAAGRGGAAVLLLGATGQGKSTLIAAAANDGWSVLSDDLVIVRRASGGPEVAGIPKTVAIPGDLGVEVPGAIPLPHDPRKRLELPPNVLSAGWHQLRGVVRVAHGRGDESELEPFTGPALTQFVLGSFPSAANQPLLKRFLPLAAEVSRLPGWTLKHASDPRARLHSSARALDDVVSNL